MKFLARLSLLLTIAGLFVPAGSANGASEEPEAFDIGKGEVIRILPDSAALQKRAIEWVSAAGRAVGAFHIEPSDGIAIRIPLTPPIQSPNPQIRGTIAEVILFVGKERGYAPILLVFTKDHRMKAFYLRDPGLKDFLKEHRLYRAELNVNASNLQ